MIVLRGVSSADHHPPINRAHFEAVRIADCFDLRIQRCATRFRIGSQMFTLREVDDDALRLSVLSNRPLVWAFGMWCCIVCE